MIKVLIINTSSKISGAEKSLIDVLEVLRPLFKCIVILPEKGELFSCLSGKVELQIIKLVRLKKGETVLAIFKKLFGIVWSAYEISKIVKLNQIDIIYSNTMHAQIYAVLIKLYTGRKVIWHVRDSTKSKWLTFVFSFFSDKILCVSNYILQQVSFKGKSELVYNGINTEIWKNCLRSKYILKDELSIPRHKILVAHIGQLIPWKKHETFIDVAKLIIKTNQDVHFVIIGTDLFCDFPQYENLLKEKVLIENLSNCFSFIDYKTNIKEILTGVDILVHLAEEEPFGRVLIEAMALEKPIIARDKGGPSEIIQDNKSGYLVPEDNFTLFADKLQLLLSDSDLRMKFGKAGRKIVLEKFSIKNLEKIALIISSSS